MVDQEASWLAVVADLGVRVVAPHAVELGEHRVTFTAFFPQFGRPFGMVVDPDWSVIEPYRTLLGLAGIGYSCVDLRGSDNESMREMLADWGWSGAPKDKPDWA